MTDRKRAETAWSDLDDDEREAVARFASLLDDADAEPPRPTPSRRGVLGGIAGVLGGGALAYNMGNARAAESAEAGTIGTGSAPVDVNADDLFIVEAGSAHALQASADGLVVPQAPGLGVGDAVAPGSTTTPVQDAADAVAANGQGGAGRVRLPPGAISEGSTVVPDAGVDLIGVGVKRGAASGATVLNAPSGAAAIDFQSGTGGNNRLDGLVIHGDGAGSHDADAVSVSGGPVSNLSAGTVHVEGFHGPAFAARGSAGVFQADLGTWRVWDLDAGDRSGVFVFEDGGPAVSFDVLAAYPSDDASASDSTIIYNTSAALSIQALNIGGTAGKILETQFGARPPFALHNWNYEPAGQNGTPPYLFSVDGWNNHIGPGMVNTGSADYVFNVTTSARNSYLARPSINITLGQTVVKVSNDPNGTVVYQGPSSEVDNQSGSVLSNPIWCQGDGVYKYSTGTGYDGGTNDRKV
jgi:hypothetical protein